MPENKDRSHYLITITYDYEKGNRKTKKLLVLNSLTSHNAIRDSIAVVPYGQKIIMISSSEYKIPTLGSGAFELVVE